MVSKKISGRFVGASRLRRAAHYFVSADNECEICTVVCVNVFIKEYKE